MNRSILPLLRPVSLFAPLAILGLGCSTVPQACDALCSTALDQGSRCINEYDERWEATAWGSPGAFAASCDVWVWETERLLRDSWWRGERNGRTLRSVCEDQAAFIGEQEPCAVLDPVSWEGNHNGDS